MEHQQNGTVKYSVNLIRLMQPVAPNSFVVNCQARHGLIYKLQVLRVFDVSVVVIMSNLFKGLLLDLTTSRINYVLCNGGINLKLTKLIFLLLFVTPSFDVMATMI